MTTAASDRVLERLKGLHPKLIDLGLGRVEALLARLGQPHRALPPVVHVAGTNGKGSTIATMRACLEAAGRRVQVYSSPHLVCFHERIRLADGLIGEDRLVAVLQACEAANGDEPVTYFEITTVAAFKAFAEDTADLLLLETGLGGRLDATNVIARPRLVVLTTIDHDHSEFLGDRLEQIAFEKAGILKPGVPVVVAPQPAEVMAVIEERAAAVGAPLLRAGKEWCLQADDDGLTVTLGEAAWRLPLPSLRGRHQHVNAAVAIVACRSLGDLAPPLAAARQGLGSIEWPGRLQALIAGPLAERVAAAGPGWTLWLDGGHNPSAGRVLSQVLAPWREEGPVHLICGMLNSKQAGAFLAALVPHVDSCHTVAIPGEANAFKAEALAEKARKAGLAAEACDSLPAALDAVLRSGAPGRILICGSVYLAGRVLDHARWRACGTDHEGESG